MNNQNIIVYRFNLLYQILKELEEDIHFKIIEISDEKTLTKNIKKLIVDKIHRKELQKLSIQNFYLTHKFVTHKIDNYRDEKLQINKNFFTKKSLNNLKNIS